MSFTPRWDRKVILPRLTLVGLIVLSGLFLCGGCVDFKQAVPVDSSWTLDEGGIVRASRTAG